MDFAPTTRSTNGNRSSRYSFVRSAAHPVTTTLRPGRRAFHRLAVQYHPDKVYHLGEEFQAMAHVKFQELKRAYDALMERR